MASILPHNGKWRACVTKGEIKKPHNKNNLTFFFIILSLLYPSILLADDLKKAEVCSVLSDYYSKKKSTYPENPARTPTAEENDLIHQANLEIFEINYYSMGAYIVDVDNDGKDDLLAWNIEGSSRSVVTEVYEWPSAKLHKSWEPIKKFSTILGVLSDPSLIRYKAVNYIPYTDSGDYSDLRIIKILRTSDGHFQAETVCQMQAELKAETQCRHPACKALVSSIENRNNNSLFAESAWPHKYMAPAGLNVFFPATGSEGDFDNTKSPTKIWRIGREGYLYQHIYWKLLGQGDGEPDVESGVRPQTDDAEERQVLSGPSQTRLRRTLAEQSDVLSRQLKKEISLPQIGEFFLFDANNRTYWAWDLDEQPYGNEIHIVYTNPKKSDYIGNVHIKSTQLLAPCESDCTVELSNDL